MKKIKLSSLKEQLSESSASSRRPVPKLNESQFMEHGSFVDLIPASSSSPAVLQRRSSRFFAQAETASSSSNSVSAPSLETQSKKEAKKRPQNEVVLDGAQVLANRRERNRLAAAASREKQKEEMEALKVENTQLKAENTQLKAENAHLKGPLARFTRLLALNQNQVPESEQEQSGPSFKA